VDHSHDVRRAVRQRDRDGVVVADEVATARDDRDDVELIVAGRPNLVLDRDMLVVGDGVAPGRSNLIAGRIVGD